MRQLLIPSILVFAAFASPLSAQRKGAGSGAGSVTFAVAVTDPSGAPVSDVKVSVSGAAARPSRTEAGRIVFERLPVGAYRMRFEKTGFVTFEREVIARGGKPIDVKVTLVPVPGPPAPPPPPVGPLPPPPVEAKLVVLDIPAFIEKNTSAASGRTTPAERRRPRDLDADQRLHRGARARDADEFIYVIAGQGMARSSASARSRSAPRCS